MIQANELRIGNLVEKSIKSGQGRKLISKINAQDIVKIYDEIGSFNYNPIPLTEEILLKCGFEKKEYMQNEYIYNGKFGFLFESFNEGTEKICISFTYNFKPLEITDLKYLHQLQNLYFALTNTELEINL